MTSASDSGHRHIVVGVDGSASSIAALNWAAHQAELTGTRLDAVTAWQWPSKYQNGPWHAARLRPGGRHPEER